LAGGPPVFDIIVAVLGFFASLAICLLGQSAAGAYRGDLGTLFPDESAHYVNGLLVERYLTRGLGQSPLRFATNLYLHYPRVTIGHWPPGFYLFSGLWMAAVSEAKWSVLLFSAVISAALAALLGVILSRRLGLLAGLLGACAFAALPTLRDVTTSLMEDPFVALLEILAALIYVRYLDTLRWRYAVWFGLVASFTILTKENGLALALLPVFSLLITRRFELLRLPSFWIPLPIVVLTCGPWVVLTMKFVTPGFVYTWGMHYTIFAVWANLAVLYHAVGAVGLAVAGLASFNALRRRSCRDDSLRTAMLALLLAVFAFHAAVPAGIEPRYMIPALATLLVLTALGIADAAELALARLPADGGSAWLAQARRVAPVLLIAAVLLPDLLCLTSHLQKPALGMSKAARQILASSPADAAIEVLIAGHGFDEGSFISEVADRDPKQRVIVVRGFKLLATGNESGSIYRARYATPTRAAKAVETAGVQYVVLVDTSKSLEWKHNRQIAAAANSRGWLLIGSYQRYGPKIPPMQGASAGGGRTLVYRVAANAGRPPNLSALQKLVGIATPF
jgi:dolichyl-phosphate-mannose-protein mannosyltransferase